MNVAEDSGGSKPKPLMIEVKTVELDGMFIREKWKVYVPHSWQGDNPVIKLPNGVLRILHKDEWRP